MNSQTLRVVDCHDVSEQPSYDIELKTDAKVYFKPKTHLVLPKIALFSVS